MPSSTFNAMRNAFKEFDPETFTEGGQSIHSAVNKKDFDPDSHTENRTEKTHEKRKRKNEQMIQGQLPVHDKAFIATCPAGDIKSKHGGWEGTFAYKHGGFPHMFENLMPSKSRTWLGDKLSEPLQKMPVLVKYPDQGGPGYPARSLGKDYQYMSENNFDMVERLNRSYKLGLGPGFRSEEKIKRAPWITTSSKAALFDPFEPFKETNVGVSRERSTQRRGVPLHLAEHNTPFISASKARRLPTELFGSFSYIPDQYVEDGFTKFGAMVEKRARALDAKRGVKPIQHPPFKTSGPTILSKNTPSIAFRHGRR
uniref:Uncharacterized protein n=1 Tax=Hanusia phi TaxID=3032 RepID=A0A7S0EHP3_9CRYP|mmetsp:Transcript_24795/g.55975  ORF Transcript_24795/g.55975 Transcript_24795/m.55975 type:complete len:312 (+) Transcript_24795:232-1167(+)